MTTIKQPAASYGVLTTLYKLLAIRQPTPQGAENRTSKKLKPHQDWRLMVFGQALFNLMLWIALPV